MTRNPRSKPAVALAAATKRRCYRRSPRLNHAEHKVLQEYFGFDASLMYKLSDEEAKRAIRALSRKRSAEARGAVGKLRKELANRAWELACSAKAAEPNRAAQNLPRLGLLMHNWHSGMWDPIYMVGSYFVSWKRYPDSDVVDRALTEIERLERQPLKASNKRELRSIAAGLRRYLADEQRGSG